MNYVSFNSIAELNQIDHILRDVLGIKVSKAKEHNALAMGCNSSNHLIAEVKNGEVTEKVDDYLDKLAEVVFKKHKIVLSAQQRDELIGLLPVSNKLLSKYVVTYEKDAHGIVFDAFESREEVEDFISKQIALLDEEENDVISLNSVEILSAIANFDDENFFTKVIVHGKVNNKIVDDEIDISVSPSLICDDNPENWDGGFIDELPFETQLLRETASEVILDVAENAVTQHFGFTYHHTDFNCSINNQSLMIRESRSDDEVMTVLVDNYTDVDTELEKYDSVEAANLYLATFLNRVNDNLDYHALMSYLKSVDER